MGNKKDGFGDKNGIFTEHLLKLWGYDEQTEGFLKNTNILKYNKQEAIQTNSQVFKYNYLVEIPNNCGLTDFCSVHQTVLPLINEYLTEIHENTNKSYIIVYGCHQEGDTHYKTNLLELFYELKKLDTSLIRFIRMEDALNLNLIKK